MSKNPILTEEELQFHKRSREIFVNVYAPGAYSGFEHPVWYGTLCPSRDAARTGRALTVKLLYRIHITRKKPLDLEKTR